MKAQVNFELAKLLKEKEFPQPKNTFEANNLGLAFNWYNEDGIYNANFKLESTIAAPTIAEVVMWLYEKHEFWICISCDCGNDNLFYSKIFSTEIGVERCVKTIKNINSPTEAYEAAIEYILNKLI